MVSRLVIVAITVVIIIAVGGGLYYSQTPISPATTPETKPTTPEVKQETTPEAKKETPITPETKKETPIAVIDGKSLYKKNCMDCHGAKGVGDTAPALSASNANRSILENGDVEHPSFKNILTPDEITEIIDYLKS